MLKKIFISSMFLIFLFVNLYTTVSYAETITLSQIVEKFNNDSLIKESNGSIIASNDDNKITITITEDGQTHKFEFVLEGTILTAKLSGQESIVEAIVATVLIDCIGQLHGYAEGELMQTLQADEIANYTIDKEGLEAKELADGIQIKVDIAKKIPLLDFSNTYIEVSDLDKALIAGDGFLQKSKGNLVFHKSGYGNEAVVFIGEKGKLTQNTYQSILSTLQVMFDTETVMHYFKQNYPNIALGNKEFSGFKIEINPEKSSMEQTVLGADNTYSFIRITINKELAKATIQNPTNSDNNSYSKKDTTQISKILPQAGESMLITLGIGISFVVLVIAVIKMHNYKDI